MNLHRRDSSLVIPSPTINQPPSFVPLSKKRTIDVRSNIKSGISRLRGEKLSANHPLIRNTDNMITAIDQPISSVGMPQEFLQQAASVEPSSDDHV